MTTDDRDTESQNPSKSFKVGEVDRLSGFFTPVWESKRRLRAESPIPSSSAAASAPSSARGSDKNSRPSTPPSAPPRRTAAGQPIANSPEATAKADVERPARTSTPPPRPTGPRRAAVSSPGATSNAPPQADGASAAGAHAPALETVVPEPVPTLQGEELTTAERSTVDAVAPGELTAPADDDAATRPPIDAEAGGVTGSLSPDASAGTTLTAGVAVSVRPVIPMPSTPGRPASRPSKPPSSSPNAAGIALKQTSPGPGPRDLREGEPESVPEAAPLLLRRPARADAQRFARGSAAAASYEKFERKLPTDSVDTFPRHRETESEREALQAAAARAAATAADPYPSHVLRTLRRTIHLSTALPEAVRQMVEKYRY
jgi:hypothetical protein